MQKFVSSILRLFVCLFITTCSVSVHMSLTFTCVFVIAVVHLVMAKDKSLKSGSNPEKKKKLDSNAENMVDPVVKKKRKKMEVEVSSTVFSVCFIFNWFQNIELIHFSQEAPVQIPQEAVTADDKRQKKDKKRKKKQQTEETKVRHFEMMN